MLFSALLQIFGEGQAISNQRLASLADQQENLDIFERLKAKQKSLASQFSAVKDQGNSSADQVHADVQRFAKDASLTIAVLLARSAKNGSELTQLLTQLGFQDVYARNRTDHFVYIFLVNVFIFFGVVVACLLLVTPVIIPAFFKSINLTEEDMTKSVVAVLMGFLIYLVMFRVLDYSRDRLLEAQDWQEGLVSYAKITLSSSLLSGVISIVIAALLVVVTLFLTSFDLLSFIARTPLELIIFVLFQAVLAALGTGFGLIYMRQAARLDRARLKLARNLLNGTAFLHACFAAALVGFISLFTYTQQIGSEPRYSAERVAKNFSAIKPTLIKTTIRGPINNYSYSMYSQADASLIDRNLRQIRDAWKGQLYGVKEIDDQQKWLAEICILLNSKFKFKDEEDEGDPVKLFKNPEKCIGQQEEVGGRADSRPAPKAEVTPESPKAPGPQANSEGQFFEFIVYLSKLYGQLDGLRPENKWSKAAYVAYQFPSIVAFILAYAFGIGCRFWRAWWLYNEVSRSDGHGQKLLEQLRKSYGDKVDFDRCLVMPIPSLGNVTALEALRYEDYRVKLFTKIQKQQVDWDTVRGAFKSTVH